MTDTDWRERALKAEAELASVEAGLGELRALLSQNHADAISGIKELRELAQRLRQDLASVTAQRDAAVAALASIAFEARHSRDAGDVHFSTAQVEAIEAVVSVSPAILQRRECEKAAIEAARQHLHAEGADNPDTDFSEWSLGMLDLRDALRALDTEGADNAG